MKILYLSTLLLFFYNNCLFSQKYTLDPRGYSGINLIRIEKKANKRNIWQIGKPQKNIFTSALSQPNAIVTDTLNPYPINDTSEFYFYLYRPGAPVSNHLEFGFNYKIDSDSLNDFGILESSFDGGKNWINLLKDYKKYGFVWFNNVPVFTGSVKNWLFNSIILTRAITDFPRFDSLIFRFTFICDSIELNKDGWLIDDFSILDNFEGIEDLYLSKIISTISPNPVFSEALIEFENDERKVFQFQVYNNSGKLVFESDTRDNYLKINTSRYQQGIYFYRLLQPEKKILSSGKIMVVR